MPGCATLSPMPDSTVSGIAAPFADSGFPAVPPAHWLRRQAIADFLEASGWGGVDPMPLAGDASFRTYYRLCRGRESAVLMDAPPPDEDVRPYVAVAGLLRRLGLSAPEVMAADVAQGFLLIEDFGDDTYTRLLQRGGDEPALYTLAIDALIALQQQAAATARPELPPMTMHACWRKQPCWSIGTCRRSSANRFWRRCATSIWRFGARCWRMRVNTFNRPSYCGTFTSII